MKPTLTVQEAALVLARSPRTVYRFIEQGRLSIHRRCVFEPVARIDTHSCLQHAMRLAEREATRLEKASRR